MFCSLLRRPKCVLLLPVTWNHRRRSLRVKWLYGKQKRNKHYANGPQCCVIHTLPDFLALFYDLTALVDQGPAHCWSSAITLQESSGRVMVTRHRDNTHKRQTSMSQAGFETTISASERPQMYVLDRAATEISSSCLGPNIFLSTLI
jgi:hypothetical protein